MPQRNAGFELAERIADIGIDCRLVVAQPIGHRAFFRHLAVPDAEGRFGQDGAWDIGAFQHFFDAQNDLRQAAHDAGVEVGVPDRQGIEAAGIADGGVQRDEAAHGVPKEDDGQAGVAFANQSAHGHDIADDLGDALFPGETADGGVVCLGAAVATMVVGVDLEALLRHDIGKAAVSARMFHQSVANHQDALWLAVRRLMPVGDGRA